MPKSIDEQLMLALFSESVDLEQVNQLIAQTGNANSIFRINTRLLFSHERGDYKAYKPLKRYDESKGCEVIDCDLTQVDSSDKTNFFALGHTIRYSFSSDSKILKFLDFRSFISPLYFAILRGDVEVVKALITKDTDLNQEIEGFSPLHAVGRGDMAILRFAHYEWCKN